MPLLTPEKRDELRDLEFAFQSEGNPITLDGREAYIIGYMGLEFAHICTRKGCYRAEFSWQAVERILKKDGRFLT